MKDVTAQLVSEAPKSNLLIRVVSALVMIPLVLAVVYFGYPYFNIFVAAVAVLMAWEWRRMTSNGRFGVQGVILCMGVLAAIYLGSMGNFVNALLTLGLTGVIFFIITAAQRLMQNKPLHSDEMDQAVHPRNALWMAAGAFYIGVPSLALIWIRNDWDSGLMAVVWLLVLVWAADSGAYGAGRLIGGAKLAPKISPNKTWAGFGGCIVSAMIAGYGVAMFAELENAIVLAAVSGLIGAVSQGGDLVESAIKRHFGVKDSSNLIPGHGGILDRVDALLAAIAMAAIISLIYEGALIS